VAVFLLFIGSVLIVNGVLELACPECRLSLGAVVVIAIARVRHRDGPAIDDDDERTFPLSRWERAKVLLGGIPAVGLGVPVPCGGSAQVTVAWLANASRRAGPGDRYPETAVSVPAAAWSAMIAE
jgi:hypothetical protein